MDAIWRPHVGRGLAPRRSAAKKVRPRGSASEKNRTSLRIFGVGPVVGIVPLIDPTRTTEQWGTGVSPSPRSLRDGFRRQQGDPRRQPREGPRGALRSIGQRGLHTETRGDRAQKRKR